MESRIISIELLNKVANYLANRPYIEVMGLIEALSKLPPHETQTQPEPVQEPKQEVKKDGN